MECGRERAARLSIRTRSETFRAAHHSPFSGGVARSRPSEWILQPTSSTKGNVQTMERSSCLLV